MMITISLQAALTACAKKKRSLDDSAIEWAFISILFKTAFALKKDFKSNLMFPFFSSKHYWIYLSNDEQIPT